MKLHQHYQNLGSQNILKTLPKLGIPWFSTPQVCFKKVRPDRLTGLPPRFQENLNAIYKTEIRRLNQKLEQAQKIIPVSWLAGGDKKTANINLE